MQKGLVRKLNPKLMYKNIVKQLSTIDDVKTIIVYGSFARGDYGPKSDIDLFMLTTKPETTEKIQDSVMELESKIGRGIQPTIRTEKELKKTDTGLLQNVFQEGKIVYLREPLDISVSSLLKQRPYVIYTFQLNNLSQKNKARFNRELYKRTHEKYAYKGFLQEIGGEKLSSGCVLISYNKKKRIEKFFNKFKVKYELMKIWR